MTNSEKAKQILAENLYMTIAVASQRGDPWIANVFYALDSHNNLYWYSSVNALHSTIINQNPIIAISIFNSTALGDEVDAVYIKAKVEEINNKREIITALTIYGQKMLETGVVKTQVHRLAEQYKDFQGLSKLRLYKATPLQIWKLGKSKSVNGKYLDSRIKVNLDT